MKKIITLLLTLFSIIHLNSQNPEYDKALADSLGADFRGMKTYILVILKTGTNDLKDKTLREQYFKGHFENINRMANDGKLIVAGPIDSNDDKFRGLFILDMTDFEEAEKLLQNDPTIKEKIFEAVMYRWYGGAALPLYLPFQKKIEKGTE